MSIDLDAIKARIEQQSRKSAAFHHHLIARHDARDLIAEVEHLRGEVRRLTRELEPHRTAERRATAAHHAYTEDLMHDGSVE